MQGLANALLQDAPLSSVLATGATATPAGNNNVPQVIAKILITGIVTSDVTHEAIFQPTVAGQYRVNVNIFPGATDAGGATMSVQATLQNGNSVGPVSSAIGCSSLVRAAGAVTSVPVVIVDSNAVMGFKTVLVGALTTGSYSVKFIVEYLGA
jgi:hypothetical protein